MSGTLRLNKYISDSGICSRREADRFIEQGNVLINGKKAKVGEQVSERDTVVVNGQIIEPKTAEEAIYIAFNKPVGIVSTTDPSEKDNMIDYISYGERIFPVGRLDKESQGLIFLTSNGDIVNKILRAGNKHEKEYVVTVNKPITDQFINGMAGGVPILGETTKKCAVTKETAFIFRIILIQGLNRQIRRMCEYFGYDVIKLERVRIMNVTLKGLPVGEWRELRKDEREDIFSKLEESDTAKPAKSSTSKKTSKKKVIKADDDLSPLKKTASKPRPKPAGSFRPKAEDKPFKNNGRSAGNSARKTSTDSRTGRPNANSTRTPKGKTSGGGRSGGRSKSPKR
jgi:23S rRNA pseudouridine2604 synthase